MLFRRATFWLTLIAAAISLFSYSGYDRDHVVLFHINILAWFIEPFLDMHTLPPLIHYAMTIGTWFLIGLGIDWAIHRYKQNNSQGQG